MTFSVAVLIACHNRRATTLRCLDALFQNRLPEDVSLKVFLVDDGSTDGTAEAVRDAWPLVEMIHGDGQLFWSRGMHRAFAQALGIGFDGYLWLNDDTVLYPDAVSRLLTTVSGLSIETGQSCVVVGSTKDDAGELSYGGSVALNRLRRFQFQKVWSADQAVECEVMNGNCVFIPRAVAEVVGNIDPAFEHAMGDIDYALRVRAAGLRVFVAAGFYGSCKNNPVAGTHRDDRLPFSKRWRLMTGSKGLPPASWYRFTRRHGGLLWPLYFSWPYIKQLVL